MPLNGVRSIPNYDGAHLVNADVSSDFEAVLSVDPNCHAARIKSLECDELLNMGELEDDYDSLDPAWPPIDYFELDQASVSDSSDCNHTGNGFACRFYNHAGCSKGERCAYSHAPDEKSIRDDLSVS